MTKLDHERLKRRLQPKEQDSDSLPATGSYADIQRQKEARGILKPRTKIKAPLVVGSPVGAKPKPLQPGVSPTRVVPAHRLPLVTQAKDPLKRAAPSVPSPIGMQAEVPGRSRQTCLICGKSVIHMKTHKLRAHQGIPGKVKPSPR
jgi:hypothetical protein